MTETERRRIAYEEDVEARKRYQAISVVRNRIRDDLTRDVEVRHEHHSSPFEEVVCDG